MSRLGPSIAFVDKEMVHRLTATATNEAPPVSPRIVTVLRSRRIPTTVVSLAARDANTKATSLERPARRRASIYRSPAAGDINAPTSALSRTANVHTPR